MLKTSFFDKIDKETALAIGQRNLPRGKAWDAASVPATNFYKMMQAWTLAFCSMSQVLESIKNETNIYTATTTLEQWREMFGFATGCESERFEELTDDQKRSLIAVIQGRQQISTIDEVQNYMNLFFPNFVILLRPCEPFSAIPFFCRGTEIMTGSVKRFVLIAYIQASLESFPYTFQFPFGTGVNDAIFLCILRKVIQANVEPILRFSSDLSAFFP